MKKYLFLLLACFSASSFAFSQKDLVVLLQKPQIVQGDFTQQRFLKSLPQPINANGVFTLIAKKGLLWEMQKPFASQMRVTPNSIAQWNGSAWLESNQMGQSQQISLFLGLLGGDIAALENQFSLALSGNEKSWTLTLTPNSLLMKQIFTQIQIKGDSLVKEIELSETQGDRTLIRFTQLQVDKTPSTFAQSSLQ